MNILSKSIATFFGSGLLPKAPGTWGTLATIPLALFLNSLGPFYMMGFVFIMLPVSVWAISHYQKTNHTSDDPGEIVIDEVIGFLITMTWLPATWQAYLLGFIIFRALDIYKPGPIGRLDQKVKGPWGVMLDDIAAGIIGNLVLQIIYYQTNWLGSQLYFS